jgi:simple sugar transport system permease protein
VTKDVKNSNSFLDVNNRIDSAVRGLIGRIGKDRGSVRMIFILLVAFAFFTALKPAIFLNPLNIQNIMIASPEIGIIALAMMLAMLTGGIDLSIVAVANLSAITITTLYSSLMATDPDLAAQMMPFIVLLGLGVGLLGGLFNGFLISYLGITPILATLGSMQIFNGLAIVWTGGKTLYGAPEDLAAAGKANLIGMPALFIALIVIAGLVALFLNKTSLGRKTQLLGANPVAARYSGINSRQVLMSTYLLTGLLGGFAGILFLARNPTSSADYGSSYVLLVIVIAVLGGTNPNGGFATVAGVVLATLTLQVVSSGFTAIRLSAYEYAIAQGAILILVMILDQLPRKKKLSIDFSKFTSFKKKVGKSA